MFCLFFILPVALIRLEPRAFIRWLFDGVLINVQLRLLRFHMT